MRKGIETVTLCWLVPRKQLISLILCMGRILHSSNPKNIVISFPKQKVLERFWVLTYTTTEKKKPLHLTFFSPRVIIFQFKPIFFRSFVKVSSNQFFLDIIPLVFWCFQGVQNETSDMKWVKKVNIEVTLMWCVAQFGTI